MRKCTRKHELGLGVASGASIKSKHNILISWKSTPAVQTENSNAAGSPQVSLCRYKRKHTGVPNSHKSLLCSSIFFQVLKLTAGSCKMEQEWVGVIRDGGVLEREA